MFKRIMGMRARHQVLFALLISFAVISFWRGMWGLLDLYIFPDDYHLSLWISMFIGIGILVLTNYATKELI